MTGVRSRKCREFPILLVRELRVSFPILQAVQSRERVPVSRVVVWISNPRGSRSQTDSQTGPQPLRQSRPPPTEEAPAGLKAKAKLRTEVPQPPQDFQNTNGSSRRQDRLRRIHNGPQTRHLPRHRISRDRKATEHLRQRQPIGQAENLHGQAGSNQRVRQGGTP